MLFNSIEFIVFFLITVMVYFLVPKKIRYIWLLITSFYFYMSWDAVYALLLLGVIFVTYVTAIKLNAINENDQPLENKIKDKKIYASICIVVCILLLVYFKYLGFVFVNINNVLGLFKKKGALPVVDSFIPVGISFFIFQSVGYVIDVYRGDTKAEKNFARYALFVSFFPQLVAGPIERSKNLLKQLATPNDFNFGKAVDGVLLMLWGFFLKMVIADRIAIFVDTVYGNYSTYGGWYLIVAVMLFAIQIYCDFAGYSTIAMGAAKVMGFNLMDNFNAPYMSGSVSEFWHRWHISLSGWFRDYLYIPLGGNKKGTVRKYINIMVVFLISGLWHGASWTFVIWGALNGLYQVIEAFIWKRKRDNCNKSAIHKIGSALLTFLLVDFSWLFFRANTLDDAINIIKSIVTADNFNVFIDGSILNCGLNSREFIVVLLGIGIIIFSDICKYRGIVLRNVIVRRGFCFKCVFVSIVVGLILLLGVWGAGYDANNFIYFQF